MNEIEFTNILNDVGCYAKPYVSGILVALFWLALGAFRWMFSPAKPKEAIPLSDAAQKVVHMLGGVLPREVIECNDHRLMITTNAAGKLAVIICGKGRKVFPEVWIDPNICINNLLTKADNKAIIEKTKEVITWFQQYQEDQKRRLAEDALAKL